MAKLNVNYFFKRLFNSLLILCLFPTLAHAAPPSTFNAEYDARLQGFNANADISLEEIDTNQFQLSSSISVKILGKTITRIEEASLFNWNSEQAQPLNYQFKQTGLGKRSHSIVFNWEEGIASTLVDEQKTELVMSEPVFDEFSMYNEIKRQVASGMTDIYLPVIDEDQIKQYHYHVIGEELLETPLGAFNSIKIERIRGPESKRVTELWLAQDWDYILLKLYQRNPKGKESHLNIKAANLGGENIFGLNNNVASRS